jgi:hypothetical protein
VRAIFSKGARVARFSAIKHTKMGKNIPKCPNNIKHCLKVYPISCEIDHIYGHKIYQHLPVTGTPKFIKIGIFGLKI